MKKIIGISILTANLMFGVSLGTSADDGGNDNNTALGVNTTATGSGSTSIGVGSLADGTSATAIGGNYSTANGELSTAVGTRSTASSLNSTAVGAWAEASNGRSTALGYGSQSSGEESTAIGAIAKATADNSIALGAYSLADEDNTVSVGRAGDERRITNVATPTNDTDATNKKYVDDEISLSASSTLSSAYSYTDSVFSSISMSGGISESEVDVKDQVILNSAKTYTDEKFDSLDKKIDTLEQTLTKELRVGVASAIALGVTPVFQNDKDNALGIGFGNYEGESAMAINYARKIASNQVLQLGTSLNAAHRAFKVGYSVSW